MKTGKMKMKFHVERTHPFLEWEGNKGQPWMLLLPEGNESPLRVA
jgi:hypothetical protein